MAKKAELLEQAKKLKLEVSEKNTIAQIEEAIEKSQESRVKSQEDNKSVDEESKTKAGNSPGKPLAKSGKRSAKGIEEAEEKAEKIERQHHRSEAAEEAQAPKKKPAPKTRSRLERRSKSYREKAKLIDKSKSYSLKDAVELAQKTSTTKFDSSVEIHVNLNVDPRQADQNVRGMVSLPHGTGKTQRIAVLAPADKHDEAKKAGADIVGEGDLLQLLDKEQLDFDVLISTPQMMAKLGKYAKLLGPRGLMPNPKSGTVSADVVTAVKEAKGGRVEYRVDKQGIVHAAVGKVGFSADQLSENAQRLLDSIAEARPASVKGAFIEKISVTTTMGPSIIVTQKA